MLKYFSNLFIGLFFFFFISAQDLPDTDILIFSYRIKNKTWKLIKKHDSMMYENQLFFTGKKNYIYVKKHHSHTAVFSSNIKSKKEKILIQDTINFFSPIQTSRNIIQLIIQDNQNKQYIARYYINKKKNNNRIFYKTYMAGYHTYMNPDTLVFYHVGSDEHRILVYLSDTNFLQVGKNPAACLYKSGPYEFLWMHKSEKGNLILEYSLTQRKNRLIMNIEKGTDYFFFNYQKNIIIIRNNQMEFFDLQGNFIQSCSIPDSLNDKKIKRFYQSPDKKIFAFVISKEK